MTKSIKFYNVFHGINIFLFFIMIYITETVILPIIALFILGWKIDKEYYKIKYYELISEIKTIKEEIKKGHSDLIPILTIAQIEFEKIKEKLNIEN